MVVGKKIHQGLLNTKPEISKPEISRTWKLERREPAWYDSVLRYSSIGVCYSHCQRVDAVCQDRPVLNLNKCKPHYITYDVGEKYIYILYHDVFLLSVHIYMCVCICMYICIHIYAKVITKIFFGFRYPFEASDNRNCCPGKALPIYLYGDTVISYVWCHWASCYRDSCYTDSWASGNCNFNNVFWQFIFV